MKVKRQPFIQHLTHDIEDEDKAWEHLDESLPNIGLIVMYFNGLEKMLDRMLCDIFSDRSDTPGLIVLQNMHYSAKVNLFARFSDDLHRAVGRVPTQYRAPTKRGSRTPTSAFPTAGCSKSTSSSRQTHSKLSLERSLGHAYSSGIITKPRRSYLRIRQLPVTQPQPEPLAAS
jgi:hypothetical protein